NVAAFFAGGPPARETERTGLAADVALTSRAVALFFAAERGPVDFTRLAAAAARRLALTDGFRIPAPAGLPRRRTRGAFEHLPDLLDEVFRETWFGDERVATGFLRPFRDTGQRVAGERHDRDRRGPFISLEAASGLPAV